MGLDVRWPTLIVFRVRSKWTEASLSLQSRSGWWKITVYSYCHTNHGHLRFLWKACMKSSISKSDTEINKIIETQGLSSTHFPYLLSSSGSRWAWSLSQNAFGKARPRWDASASHTHAIDTLYREMWRRHFWAVGGITRELKIYCTSRGRDYKCTTR